MGKRITLQQAQDRWDMIAKEIKLVSKKKNAIDLPSIDLHKIFGNQKTMDVDKVVSKISEIINQDIK